MKKFIFALTLVSFVFSLAIAADTNFSKNSYKEHKVKEASSVDKVNIPDHNMILQGGDTVNDATVINDVDFTDSGTTEGYTDDYDEQCTYASESPDVVYSFTPAEDMSVTLDLYGSGYDTKIFVYENSVTPGEPFACNDDYWDDYTSYLRNLDITGGNTYFIIIDGYDDEFGNYVFTMEPGDTTTIAGNTCDDAIEIASLPYTTTGNSCGDFTDECIITDAQSSDVIYELTLDSGYYLTASLIGSSYDTKIAVFQDECCTGAGTEYLYNDDFGDDLQSQVTAAFPAGTYYIVVDGYNGACGDYALNVFEADPPADASCEQSYIGPDGDWAFQRSDSEDGPFIVYDDFLCEDETEMCGVRFWGLDLTYNGGFLECDENPTTMEIKIYPDNGSYAPDVDNPINTYTVVPEMTNTGVYYNSSYELIEYYAEFDSCCQVNGGWISIEGVADDGNLCFFMWSSSLDGNGLAYQLDEGVMGFLDKDLSLEMIGSDVDIDDNSASLPIAVDMMTNYPNPFNPTTTIAFTLQNPGNVAIDVYDLLGRRVDTIKMGHLDNTQVHSVDYDASRLATGVYFYNLMVDGVQKASERFSLLK